MIPPPVGCSRRLMIQVRCDLLYIFPWQCSLGMLAGGLKLSPPDCELGSAPRCLVKKEKRCLTASARHSNRPLSNWASSQKWWSHRVPGTKPNSFLCWPCLTVKRNTENRLSSPLALFLLITSRKNADNTKYGTELNTFLYYLWKNCYSLY